MGEDGLITGENNAFQIVSQSIDLARNTAEAWNTVWVETFDRLDGGLWGGLVNLGLVLAAISILFVVVTTGREIIEKQSWAELVQMFIWSLIIIMFLGNNGALLSQSTLAIRGFAHDRVMSVLEVQLGELTFRNAISQVGISSAARQALENLYSECERLVGDELLQCWSEKQEQAEQILAEAERQAGGPLEQLRRFVGGLVNAASEGLGEYVGAVLRSVYVPFIRMLLVAVQWAFVNMLEASLLLTALFAPIAMGLSLLPLQGRPIWAWLTGFMSLFGVQLGYNIVVGLGAVVVVRSGGELITDVAFLAFLSIFARGLAVLIAGGGGIALYNGISNNVKSVIDFSSNAIGAVTRLAVKAMA
jgi:hypothetical protein